MESPMLFAIKCRFKIRRSDEQIYGLAICSDADTPVTFIRPDGTPYNGATVWSYELIHDEPWAKFEYLSQ